MVDKQILERSPWKNATLIAGPTASGKSSLALQIARENNGVIVNTDSMQIYDVLQLLTARPAINEMGDVPHYLYGHINPAADYSTGHWMEDVARSLNTIEHDRHVVFVGGTGLYFRALLGGLSPMPPVDGVVRERWRYRLNEEGAGKLHRILRSRDPEMAMTLNPADGQRIARALEVLEGSGKSILWWQAQRGDPLVDPENVVRIVLDPNREKLKLKIHQRFDEMVELGAIDEVRALLHLQIPASQPAMKAIGVSQIGAYLAGELTLDEAIDLSKTATRQYAKRQMTWFRNQLTVKWNRRDVL